MVNSISYNSSVTSYDVLSLITFVDGGFGADNGGGFLLSSPSVTLANLYSLFRLQNIKSLLRRTGF
jgi:hypothetical protein